MTEAVKIAQQYYDGTETDKLYAAIWGGVYNCWLKSEMIS